MKVAVSGVAAIETAGVLVDQRISVPNDPAYVAQLSQEHNALLARNRGFGACAQQPAHQFFFTLIEIGSKGCYE